MEGGEGNSKFVFPIHKFDFVVSNEFVDVEISGFVKFKMMINYFLKLSSFLFKQMLHVRWGSGAAEGLHVTIGLFSENIPQKNFEM